MRPAARVRTVPAGAPFLALVADTLLDGSLFDRAEPLAPDMLAATTVYVPTRRAGRALATTLVARAGRALLLPRIVSLGEIGDEPAVGETELPAVDFGPAIGDLDRRLALFRLVDRWRAAIAARPGDAESFIVGRSRADAFALAGDLARLIDETILDGVPLARLASPPPEGFDPSRHDEYWSMGAAFTRIAAEYWPIELRERGVADAAMLAVAKLEDAARRIADGAVDGPVVVAGSTGSIAATATLMRAVARHPLGAVVLPGLDHRLDDHTWSRIGSPDAELPTRFAHPQVMLKRALGRIGIAREDVRVLGTALAGREQLVSEMFRPAEASEAWQANRPDRDAVDSLALIEARDEGEEAVAVALVLREALETPGRTIALVTPDRRLAEAVRLELQRWKVEVSDSAGCPLADAPAGMLARLVLEAARPDAGAADILGLLRHPLVAGWTQPTVVDALEIAGLRGRRLQGGVAALPALMERAAMAGAPSRHETAPRRRVEATVLAASALLARDLRDALFSVFDTPVSSTTTLRSRAARHRAALETLSGPLDALGDDARQLASLFQSVEHAEADGPELTADEYLRIFEGLAREIVVAPPVKPAFRVEILGLLEARLLTADRLVLAGLNEGVWPPEPRGDPLLNRAMRVALGLQPPERRIGQSAHDLQMLLGHSDVILTRAARRDGQPATASRFLLRLKAWLGEGPTGRITAAGAPYLAWAGEIDRPVRVRPVPRPAPVVAPALLPARLSLTEIETLYRDPYAIHARRVLRLDPLDPLDPPLDARDRGIAIHAALGAYASELSRDGSLDRLLDIARSAFAPVVADDPVAAAFWWQRFAASAPDFVDWDSARRSGLSGLHAEVPGRLDIPVTPEWSLTLATRADRVEALREGGLAVIDYKTGQPPSTKQILSGYAPQLPLTAALLLRGGFSAVPAGSVRSLIHYRIAGKPGERAERGIVDTDAMTVDALADEQFRMLVAVLAQHAAGTRGFISRRRPEKRASVGDFDLLARHLEWSQGGNEDGEGEE